jgi:hypothetical protein
MSGTDGWWGECVLVIAEGVECGGGLGQGWALRRACWPPSFAPVPLVCSGSSRLLRFLSFAPVPLVCSGSSRLLKFLSFVPALTCTIAWEYLATVDSCVN